MVAFSSTAPSVRFARQELCRYLERMTGQPANPDGIRFEPLSQEALAQMRILDPFWDDGYQIDVSAGRGHIRCANNRSALLAAYRLLTEVGCAFLRPGPMGERIPAKPLSAITVRLHAAAAYRHRGICIEGACSLENALAIIDFAPKAGYNAYFVQFQEPYTFFERWYAHAENPLRPPEPFDARRCQQILTRIEKALRLRGLLYHAVGHGWVCQALGLPARGWDPQADPLTAAQRRLLAQVNGRRELFGGIAMNTQLCLSNPEARARLVDAVTGYAIHHPEVHVLHVWLGDGENNHCECDACRTATPSDWYVRFLNELDVRLREWNLSTRIAFLAYCDLLYPPAREQLARPERFLFLFAPIARSFTKSLYDAHPGTLPTYQRNRMEPLAQPEALLACLAGWKRQFQGDAFAYEYHLCGAAEYDPGHLRLCQTLSRDCKALRHAGLQGMMSCQLQRVAAPHGCGLWLTGRLLFSPRLSEERERARYFRLAFGPAFLAALHFCEALSACFPMAAFAQEHPLAEPGTLDALRSTLAMLTDAALPAPVNLDMAQARSWAILRFWREMMMLLVQALLLLGEGDLVGARQRWEALSIRCWQGEADYQAEFDAHSFLAYYRRHFA